MKVAKWPSKAATPFRSYIYFQSDEFHELMPRLVCFKALSVRYAMCTFPALKSVGFFQFRYPLPRIFQVFKGLD